MPLQPCQQRALESVTSETTDSLEELAHIFEMCHLPQASWRPRRSLQVALHFHPDRLNLQGLSVAESLLRSGVYQNQFESGLTAGSSSLHHRAAWEDRLFDRAYARALPEERPKYGALDLLRQPDGPAPRFGSCYFLLQPSVTGRCTFCFGDSYRGAEGLAAANQLAPVLALLYREAFERETCLGLHSVRPPLLWRWLEGIESPPTRPGRNLDHYLEAQIHGPISLQQDAESLWVDGSFAGTATGDHLQALAQKFSLPLHWLPGFRLHSDGVVSDFRGPTMPEVARRLGGGELHARHLGLGRLEEIERKRFWHLMVRYGSWVRGGLNSEPEP